MEYKGDRFPIGGWQIERNRAYKTQQVQLKKGDTVVLSSDGFADQHGGEFHKKFKKARFKELISTIGNYSVQEQTQLLREHILDWKKNKVQTDDVTVITLKF
jgi:serine phosphatase RsbU (regulator of sigma subunit)